MASFVITYKWGDKSKVVFVDEVINESEAVMIANYKSQNEVPSTASVEAQFVSE